MTGPLFKDLKCEKTTAELEASDSEVLLVCCLGDGSEARFKNNVTGFCAECDHQIYYSANAPRNAKRICRPCAEIMQAEDAKNGIGAEHCVTKEAMEEILDYLLAQQRGGRG